MSTHAHMYSTRNHRSRGSKQKLLVSGEIHILIKN